MQMVLALLTLGETLDLLTSFPFSFLLMAQNIVTVFPRSSEVGDCPAHVIQELMTDF